MAFGNYSELLCEIMITNLVKKQEYWMKSSGLSCFPPIVAPNPWNHGLWNLGVSSMEAAAGESISISSLCALRNSFRISSPPIFSNVTIHFYEHEKENKHEKSSIFSFPDWYSLTCCFRSSPFIEPFLPSHELTPSQSIFFSSLRPRVTLHFKITSLFSISELLISQTEGC